MRAETDPQGPDSRTHGLITATPAPAVGSDDDEVGTEVHGDIDGSRKFRAPTPVKSSSIPRVAPTRGVRARHQKGAASSPVEGG